MKKIISLILCIVIFLSLVSCDDEKIKYDEDEVLLAAAELIVKSGELNTLFWGEGIRYEEDDLNKNGYYYPANPYSLIRYGVRTVEDMKEMARDVFSVSYCESIFSSVLSSSGTKIPKTPVNTAILYEWGSRGREFKSLHPDQKKP